MCLKQQDVPTIQLKHSHCLHNTTTPSVKECTCNSSGVESSTCMNILKKTLPDLFSSALTRIGKSLQSSTQILEVFDRESSLNRNQVTTQLHHLMQVLCSCSKSMDVFGTFKKESLHVPKPRKQHAKKPNQTLSSTVVSGTSSKTYYLSLNVPASHVCFFTMQFTCAFFHTFTILIIITACVRQVSFIMNASMCLMHGLVINSHSICNFESDTLYTIYTYTTLNCMYIMNKYISFTDITA